MPKIKSLAYVLGGGKGERLYPLTKDRAKPAVPFGAQYRVIDFVLSNLLHSKIEKIYLLTQYESRSLDRHITRGWYLTFGIGRDPVLTLLPARGSNIGGWYIGTADAIYKNVRYIEEENPLLVDVFGADHIYLMDISQMNQFHLDTRADLTISAIPVKREIAAKNYGVLTVDDNWRLIDFQEKPENPAPIPGNEEYCFASMGNYAFKPNVLLEELILDQTKEAIKDKEIIASDPTHFSSHDFGFDIIPSALRNGRNIYVYNFMNNYVPGQSEKETGFWRDIGTLDQFYQANMEVRSAVPPLNLYNPEWPVLTYVEFPQPAKSVGKGALDSICANNTIISHSTVERCVLSYAVKIDDGSTVRDSILLGYNYVGKRTIIENSIIDRYVEIPDDTVIGRDKELDAKRGLAISPGGITVVPRKYRF